ARADLDGLLVNPGLSWGDMGMASFQLQQAMGLRDLRLSASMNSGGATAATMVQVAAQAVASCQCRAVACGVSGAALKPATPASPTHGCRARGTRRAAGSGFGGGLAAAYGQCAITASYAMLARRHMHRFGTTNDHLGAIAVAQRQW